MNTFEEKILALVESIAEKLIMNLIAQLEAKLGINVPAEKALQTPQSVE